MACNCSSSTTIVPAPVNAELPGLGDLTPCAPAACGTLDAPVSKRPCVSSSALQSASSNGFTLPTGYDDAIADYNGEGVRLLGRIGRVLARLSGTGFISIRDGLAFVVQSVPLKITQLWHNWYKPSGINKRPILGAPYPFPNHVVADSEGNLFGVKGLTGEGIVEDSVHVFSKDREQWETRETCDVPLKIRGLAPRSTGIEIAGFVPIATSGESTDVRELQVLTGSGIIVVNQQATIPSSCDCEGCTPEAAVASVATFLPFPDTEDAEATYTLKWKTTGAYWDLDT